MTTLTLLLAIFLLAHASLEAVSDGMAAQAVNKPCTHSFTKYFEQHRLHIPKDFFYPKTLSSATGKDRCEPYSNDRLRKEYASWIKSTDQVEHMIDRNNGPPELAHCNKNIRGNLVMAIGAWNQEVGQLCWDDVAREKRNVYGNEAFEYAYQSVKTCCGTEGGSSGWNVAVAVSLTLIVLMLVAHLVLYRESPRYREMYDDVASKVVRELDKAKRYIKQEPPPQEYELLSTEV